MSRCVREQSACAAASECRASRVVSARDACQGDHRFRRVNLSRQNPRKMIVMWAAKEHSNLLRLERAGVPCPRALLHREHVVIMSLVGKRGRPAPPLVVRSLVGVAAACLQS